MKQIIFTLATTLLLISTKAQNVGIGTTSPETQLDVNGGFRLRGNGAGTGKVLTSDATGNATWQTPVGTGVGFSATLSSTIVIATTDAYILSNFQEFFDDGGDNFNASTGFFTAPSAGVYRFDLNIGWSPAPAGTNIYYMTRFYITSAAQTNIISQTGQPISDLADYGINLQASVTYKLSAGDQIHVEVFHTGASPISVYGLGGGSAGTVFSGVKLY